MPLSFNLRKPMIKAVSTTLGLALFCVAASVQAQQTVSQTAEEESVRRQEGVILLRKTLADAAAAETRKDLAGAAKLYEEAYSLVQRVGVGIEQERKQTLTGFTKVRLALSNDARQRGDLNEARVQAERVLKVDPTNSQAQYLKKELDKAIEAKRGKVPDAETLARLPEFKEANIKNNTVVQDAVVLFQAGKLDEAEAKLNLTVRQDPENRAAFYYLQLIKNARSSQISRRREMDSMDSLLEVQKAWTKSTTSESLPVGNPFTYTNTVYTGRGRQAIYAKLDKIRLSEVFFPGVPLSEVAKHLKEQSVKADPDHRGINFIISSTLESGAQQAGGAVDPVTGQPVASAATEAVDLNNVQIRLDPALQDLRMADILDAITMVADKPLKYSVTEFAVIFSVKLPEAQQLYTRTFKVNPNSFVQGLESVTGISLDFASSGGQGGQGGGGGGGGRGGGGGGQGGQGGGLVTVPRVDISGGLSSSGGGGGFGGGGGGGGGVGGGGQSGVGITGLTRTNSMDAVQFMVRNFFTAAGVDLGGTNSLTGGAGKAVFYNDRSGDLFVRATALDLDIIEAAIHILDAAPPQLLIEAKFVEVSQSDTKALGFDWTTGNFLVNQGAIGVQGGSAPSYPGNPTINSPGNPNGVFPSTAGVATALPNAVTDGNLTSGLRNKMKNVSGTDSTIPALATMTGILTDPQFRMVLRAIEQREGADILASPRVLAVSGRQAQISAVDIPTIITGLNTTGGVGGGGATALGTTGGGSAATGGFNFSTQQFPTGPTLDVIPYVASDGFTIQMTLLPVMTEFLGYDDVSSRFKAQQQIAVGSTVGSSISQEQPLPRIRVRQVITHAVVWDGQTVMLGGLISEDVNKVKDKVPVLGDIPLLGRLFTSESNFSKKKNLMIFVTPSIIDPAGNRVHAADKLPYDPNVIPPQKPVAQ